MRERGAVAVECRDLSVALGGNRILRDLSLRVDGGAVCGLLGANGSGKTTLLKAVAGQLPHTGTVRWREEPGRPPGEVVLGLQSTGCHPRRRTRDHVRFLQMTGFVDEELLDRLIDRLSLREAWNDRPAAMSFGQRQSLNVLGPLAARARVYLLDEPFAGLDARRVTVVRDRILDLRTAGATVIVTSHDLAPVENILDTVVVLDSGTLHFAGEKAGFVRHTGAAVVQITCADADDLGRLLADSAAGPSQSDVSVADDVVTVVHPDYHAVVALLLESRVPFTAVAVNASPLRSALERELPAYRAETRASRS